MKICLKDPRSDIGCNACGTIIMGLSHTFSVDSINDQRQMTNELHVLQEIKSTDTLFIFISICHGLKIPKVNL